MIAERLSPLVLIGGLFSLEFRLQPAPGRQRTCPESLNL
jgi:hypothetical protein